MPTFYCIHGEAFHGDGTTKNPATVAGGVGAFNDAIAVLDNTVLAPDGLALAFNDDDTCIFKTNHLGVDITATLAANLTIDGSGTGFRKTYIFDDGREWVGEAGVFTIDMVTNRTITQGSGSYIDAYDLRLRFYFNFDGNSAFNLAANAYFTGIHLWSELPTANYDYPTFYLSCAGTQQFQVGLLKHTIKGTSYNSGQFMTARMSDRSVLRIAHHIVDMNGAYHANGLYTAQDTGACVRIHVGTLELLNFSNSHPLMADFAMGSSLTVDRVLLNNPDYNFIINDNVDMSLARISLLGAGSYDFIEKKATHTSMWRAGLFYPVLNAFLPDKITPWSIRVNLLSSNARYKAVEVTNMDKWYDQPSGIKTLTVEALIYNQYTNPTNDEYYFMVTYEDSSGVIHTEYSKDSNAMTVSDAVWDSTNYGAINYIQRRMVITTKFPVGINTDIQWKSFVNVPTIDGTSFYFIDPELGVV